MSWLKDLFKREIVYKVKSCKIKKPRKDEVTIFLLPDANQEVIQRFKQKLKEYHELNSKYGTLIVGGDVKISYAKKKRIKVKE